MSLINEEKFRKKLARKNLPAEVEEDILKDVSDIASSLIDDRVRKYKNKQRIIENDKKKDHQKATDVLTDEDIATLPIWVKEQIQSSKIIGRSKKVIQTPDGRKYHLKNKLNHLSGAEWTFFINSIINTNFPANGPESYAHEVRKIHPSPKPPQLMRDIIKFFTKENELVFDYFSGVGGTQIGASLCGRRALGVDLEDKYHQAYEKAALSLGLDIQKTITGNSLDILEDGNKINEFLGKEKFSLVLIDPPYGDMMSREKTGSAAKNGNRDATPFSSNKNDLGNTDWVNFRKLFKKSVDLTKQYLKPNGHIVVFIKDLQPSEDSLNLLHCDLIHDLDSLESVKYLGTKIWADQSVNLYPYGYPFGYVSNQIHQYILVFKFLGDDQS